VATYSFSLVEASRASDSLTRLTAGFFVGRARQLYRPVMENMKDGLASVQAQALIFDGIDSMQETYQRRKFYWRSGAAWLDLHATGVGIGRYAGEPDSSLARRTMKLCDTTIASLRAELAAAWLLFGAGWPAPELLEAPVVFWGPVTTGTRAPIAGEAILEAKGENIDSAPLAIPLVTSGYCPRLILHFNSHDLTSSRDPATFTTAEWSKFNSALAVVDSNKAAGVLLDVWFDQAWTSLIR
jgi:hypothetical protein